MSLIALAFAIGVVGSAIRSWGQWVEAPGLSGAVFLAQASEHEQDEDVSITSAQSAMQAILGSYRAGDYEATVKLTEEFYARHHLARDNFALLLFKAESQYHLGQTGPGIESYRRTIPFIEQLNNVQQRRYAFVFFRLAVLYHRQARYDDAIRFVEAGLTREPQSIYYQILLGELFRERGDPDRALRHFNQLLPLPSLTLEERAVLTMKIDRVKPRIAHIGEGPPGELTGEQLYSGFSFGIVPLKNADVAVSLRHVCLMLESKWLVSCEVLEPVQLDEAVVLDQERRQYSGDRVLAELLRLYPMGKRPHRFMVAFTGRDLFGPGTNYVFSWQDPRSGVGVVSSHRFLAELEDFYEREVIATRRLVIQFISTTASLMGFVRPTRPDCPSAYPHDFQEFLQKGSKLCDSERQQRDELLKRIGGRPMAVGVKKKEEIGRLYGRYHLD